ncbi:MAG: helix-turn-helix transcriptional regulator [Candidatus Pacebacteria bacterium]|jgi:DNA-binding XRE family transcriptional regulator|nr:helix-turn-helix transcriptional regulator [Candidatus Paceibacterota bacterium]MBT3512039.1 helix-turn-helix transcriptional regulator [Candidatus Paceibacterota bacterium]MBT4004469.1 helix-turn-helix transcriptional regulator [Candidatus Paceibacterota bacterium]MBT4359070.1 helix-turn-helix transcriptional regulator [Candidatus Paceibacterota bacterium]MBT4681365.1 helix-turn-helix transcriptional regulator [Candidatus Paceibacterota bacterium]
MKSYNRLKFQLLKNKEIKKSYDDLRPEYDLINLLIEKRLEKGLTQTELASKIGTKQSAISRLESGTYNPSLSFLYKIAQGLEMKLSFSFD